MTVLYYCNRIHIAVDLVKRNAYDVHSITDTGHAVRLDAR